MGTSLLVDVDGLDSLDGVSILDVPVFAADLIGVTAPVQPSIGGGS